MILDDWFKEVAPSTELRKWFSHDPIKWNQFQKKYSAELDDNVEALKPLVSEIHKGTVTLQEQYYQFCFLISTVNNLYLSTANMLLIGIFSGLYLMPQDSYVQAASRNEVRGQNVAAANFLGWCTVFFASFIYYCLHHIIGLSASQDFGVLVALIFYCGSSGCNFFSFLLLRLSSKAFAKCFLKEMKGGDVVPKSGSGLFYASEWRAALFFLSFRERIIKLSASSSKRGFKHFFFIYGHCNTLTG